MGLNGREGIEGTDTVVLIVGVEGEEERRRRLDGGGLMDCERAAIDIYIDPSGTVLWFWT